MNETVNEVWISRMNHLVLFFRSYSCFIVRRVRCMSFELFFSFDSPIVRTHYLLDTTVTI